MGYPVKGAADYFALGDFDAAGSECGRKAKASTMVKNWQGLYRHPWHNEPRQPQDFARGVKDITTVPWAQHELDQFVQLNIGFPASVVPSPLTLLPGSLNLLTETTDLFITTEAGLDLTAELAYVGTAGIVLPGWVIPVSYAWSWLVGGAGIVIASPTSISTLFGTTTQPAFGLAKCIITDSRGGTATVLLPVATISEIGRFIADSIIVTADSITHTADEGTIIQFIADSIIVTADSTHTADE
jgi:hypothetical protein